jgi:propionyl-CoA synthetase
MRRIADGQEYTTPATIDDPAILDEIADALARLGYAQTS